MKCPRCQQENPPQAKFCLECATPLARRCANCGTPLPAAAKFCVECAVPVSAPGSPPRFAAPESYTPKHLAERIINSKAALEGERKQVTVLFADLKSSMELLGKSSRFPVWSMTPWSGHRCALTRRCNDERRGSLAPI